MNRCVITLNAGSSSIKFTLFEEGAAEDGGTRALTPLAIGLAEMVGEERRITVHDGAGAKIYEVKRTEQAEAPFHAEALRRILTWRQSAFPDANVVAAGHRVVHGGVNYSAPVIVTDEVLKYLHTLIPLAPLHEPYNIAGILGAREAWPHVEQVA